MGDVIGRGVELRAVQLFLEQVAAGRTALVFEGEAGIGKTTLWASAIEAAREAGMRVLATRCAEQETVLLYAVLADLLADVPADVATQLPEPQRRAFEVALLREDPGGRPVDARTVAAASLGVVRSLAHTGPLMIAVDDPQWVDAASRRAMAFVVRRLDPTDPVAFVFAVRTGEAIIDPFGLDAAFGAEHVRHVLLGPLDDQALERLLRRAVGDALSGTTLLEIETVARGNPLFALEIARATAGMASADGGVVRVPATVREQMGERLAHLPADTRRALLTAACVARPTEEFVHVVSGVPEDAIDLAVDARVLERFEGGLRFAHPLLASVAYVDAPSAERVTMHRRIAETSTDAEERARHLALTGDPPDPAIAEALEEGSAWARTRGAPSVGVELSVEAIRFTPPEAEADRRRRSILVADCLYDEGRDIEQAEAALRVVLPGCPPGTVRAGVRWRLARCLTTSARNREAEEVLAAALDEVGEDTVLEAAIYRCWCWAALGLYRHADLPELARASVRAAERAGEPRGLASSIAWLALAEVLVGDGLHPDMLERAMRLWPARDRPGAAEVSLAVDEHPGWAVGWCLLLHDRFEDARAAFETMWRAAHDAGNEDWEVAALCEMALVHLVAGDWASAQARIAEAVAVAGLELMNGIELFIKGSVEAHIGDERRARDDLERALAVALDREWLDGAVLGWSALGMLELSLGDPAAANRHLARATGAFERSGIREPGAAVFIPDAVEALVGLGRLDEADQLTRRLQERTDAVGRSSTIAAARRCRGLVLGAKGDLEDAVAALSRAVDGYDDVPLPFERARTVLSLGSMLRRARRKADAREALKDALAAFERLGAGLWAARARAELGSIGGRAPLPDRLTPTEERIARLAAAGRSNREIAQALFLSVRTVEGHLSHAYAKLGVRSRTQLAFALEALPTT